MRNCGMNVEARQSVPMQSAIIPVEFHIPRLSGDSGLCPVWLFLCCTGAEGPEYISSPGKLCT
jgi:hypothetical protein